MLSHEAGVPAQVAESARVTVKAGVPDADRADMAVPLKRCEQGGIVLGWLLRVSVLLLVLGVLAFDVFSLAYTNVTTVDDAGVVASSGAEVLLEHPRAVDDAKDSSLQQAADLGVAMRAKDWWVDETGEVHVTVSRTAPSVALHYLPALRRYFTVRAVGTAASR